MIEMAFNVSFAAHSQSRFSWTASCTMQQGGTILVVLAFMPAPEVFFHRKYIVLIHISNSNKQKIMAKNWSMVRYCDEICGYSFNTWWGYNQRFCDYLQKKLAFSVFITRLKTTVMKSIKIRIFLSMVWFLLLIVWLGSIGTLGQSFRCLFVT